MRPEALLKRSFAEPYVPWMEYDSPSALARQARIDARQARFELLIASLQNSELWHAAERRRELAMCDSIASTVRALAGSSLISS